MNPSTDLPPAGPTVERPSLAASALRAWNRFWFTPADPTLLGLIRLCCGSIALYTILAYTLDLQEFFGEKAWYHLENRLESVHEEPAMVAQLSWDDTPPAPLPTTPEQQQYANEYLRKWNMLPPGPYPKTEEEAREFDDYRSRWGVDPRLLYTKGMVIWSLWFHVSDPTWMLVLHWIMVLITFLFTIGFCTRITSVLAWFSTVNYIQRTGVTLFGVDTMMTIVLLYLMIGPSGAALSVDRLLARWWARAGPRFLARWRGRPDEAVAASAPAASLPVRPAPSVSANVALRLLQVHVCIIYLTAGLAKLQGAAWWNGTAVWYTLANYEFAPMQYDLYLNTLRALSKNRLILELFLTLATVFTLFFEICYAFLVWRPATRWLILGMAVTLHGFIGLFMGLKTFSLIMLTMNLAFLPPEAVYWLLRPFTPRRWGEVPLQTKAASLRPPLETAPVGGVHVKRQM